MLMKKVYCFVDETGQDTKGNFFLVSIVLKEKEGLDTLEQKLLEIESSTGRFLKWKKLSFEDKIIFLDKLKGLTDLKNAIYFSVYKNSMAYTPLISLSIAKAILAQPSKEIITTVTIDGLNDKDRIIVSHELKKLKIRYRKIRGLKDEQSVFLRLAHVFANFLRDYKENQKYAIEAIGGFNRIISEI